MKRLKILVISDHMFSPSGVGTQTNYIFNHLLKTGNYVIRQMAGAIRHNNYNPIKTDEYGEDLIIYPVDNYGSIEMVRSMVRLERPDAMWIMTDPRFFTWLWDIENEIRPLVPIFYYHVWDNYPYPMFNRKYYLSNDKIVTISKVTDDIVKSVAPEVDSEYLPHAVNNDMFKKHPKADVEKFKRESFESILKDNSDKFIFFFNGRNARRKQTGSLVFWFAKFLEKVGKDKACLVLHTDPMDENGNNLEECIRYLGLTKGEVLFSRQKVPSEAMSMIYNSIDCTVNISDAEGFGCSLAESLSCETPVICTKTGGMSEQAINDDGEELGVVIEPGSRAVIGSQEVPYIYEDRLSEEDVVNAMLKMYNMSKEEREKLGKKGREHILKNFSFNNYIKRWDEIFQEGYEKYGSWETRKNYKPYNFETIEPGKISLV